MNKTFSFSIKTVWSFSKKRLIIDFILNILKQFFNVFYGVYFLRTILICLQNNEPKTKTVFVLVFMLILNIIFYIFKSYYDNIYIPKFTLSFTTFINNNIYKKRTNLPTNFLTTPDNIDKYVRITENTAEHILNYTTSIGKIIGLIFALSLIFTYIVSVDIFAVLFTFIPLLLTLLIKKRSAKLKYKLNVATTISNRKKEYAKRIMYLPKYIGEIKFSNIYKKIKTIYTDGVTENIHQYKIIGKTMALLEAVAVVISDALIVFIPYIYLIIRMILGKYFLVGDIIGIAQSTMYFTWDIESIIDEVINMNSSKYYINEYLEFIKLKEEASYDNKFIGNAVIELNNVNFKYETASKNALNHINLKINPGEKIAIVGESGSGKTTLISLLLNLHNEFTGSLTLNGVDIRTYSREFLNDFYGVLFQNFQIHPFSIYDNICLGNDIDKKSVEKIIDKFDFNGKLDDISKSYSKEFNDDGIVLSGGQKQKLAITRLLAKNSPFVILDEPTSALDAINEKQIYEDIFKLLSDKTIIFISHRLSSVSFVDKILVLKDGELVEEGTHKELMDNHKHYYELYSIQAKPYWEEKLSYEN